MNRPLPTRDRVYRSPDPGRTSRLAGLATGPLGLVGGIAAIARPTKIATRAPHAPHVRATRDPWHHGTIGWRPVWESNPAAQGQRRARGPHGHDTVYLTFPCPGQPRSRLGDWAEAGAEVILR